MFLYQSIQFQLLAIIFWRIADDRIFTIFAVPSAELMLVGFISLTITLLRTSIVKICVSSSLYDKWTPCKISSRTNATAVDTTLSTMPGQKYSAWAPSEYYWAPAHAPQHGRRLLADAATVNHCAQVCK